MGNLLCNMLEEEGITIIESLFFRFYRLYMHKDKCPHCHTRSGLNNYNVLILSLENWPTILLFTFAVLAFAEKFQYGSFACSAFIAVAVIPVVFSFEKKMNCENCGVDFKEKLSSPDLYNKKNLHY